MIIKKLMRSAFTAAMAGAVVLSGMSLAPLDVSADVLYSLSGTAHVQEVGDTDGTFDPATGELVLGTEGQAQYIESFTIELENDTGYEGTIEYQAHVQDIGWMEWVSAGTPAGTTGEAKRIEGVRMQLTGDLAQYYTIEYAVSVEEYGNFQGWVCAGELAGTTGENKGIEEIRVRLVAIETEADPEAETIVEDETAVETEASDVVEAVSEVEPEEAADIKPGVNINYKTHVQDYGWESAWKTDGEVSGSTGEAKRLEAIYIDYVGTQYSGGVEYRTHVQDYGWQQWVTDGQLSGTSGQSKRLEGIEIKLTGEIANYYDIYYRVHCEKYGWLAWAKNGELSGTQGLGLRLEAIQIVLVAKGSGAPGDINGVGSVSPYSSITPKLNYKTHVQDYGWESAWKTDGEVSGSTGEGKRLEAIYIDYVGTEYSGGVKYCTHVQDYGWQQWVADGQLSGTSGLGKRLEGIEIELTGEVANYYDIYYRVHCEKYGWLAWAKNGELSGTQGFGLRLEAIQIVLVEKGGSAPGAVNGIGSGSKYSSITPKLNYKTHVQDLGWEPNWCNDGDVSGSTGQGKRLEGIYIEYVGTDYTGGVKYCTHVQDYGWQQWVADGQLSGTTGLGKRLEGIQIELTGEVANYYDIYYRVHCEKYGWLGWAKNGEYAGTEDMGLRLEAIQIVLVEKGGSAPGNVNGIVSAKSVANPQPVININYKSHIQDMGWESDWTKEGGVSGTTGSGKRIEAISIEYIGTEYSGGISYCALIEGMGYQDWVSDGELAGTVGLGRRLEAIKIVLTGDVANYYDVYYRVHCESYGWLGWAKNGELAGTENLGNRLEAIQIILVEKGDKAPGDIKGVVSNTTEAAFKYIPKTKVCLDAGHIGKYNQSPSVPAYYESDFTWKFHLYLKEALEKYGIEVVLTRSDQFEAMGVYERGLAAAGCDLFISIHSDANNNKNYNYPSAYCAINGSADTIGMALAQVISADMGISAPKLFHRVGENGDYYGVLRGATAVGVPGILLEHGFYTNPYCANWMLNDANLKKLAEDEALVIAQYFGLA